MTEANTRGRNRPVEYGPQPATPDSMREWHKQQWAGLADKHDFSAAVEAAPAELRDGLVRSFRVLTANNDRDNVDQKVWAEVINARGRELGSLRKAQYEMGRVVASLKRETAAQPLAEQLPEETLAQAYLGIREENESVADGLRRVRADILRVRQAVAPDPEPEVISAPESSANSPFEMLSQPIEEPIGINERKMTRRQFLPIAAAAVVTIGSGYMAFRDYVDSWFNQQADRLGKWAKSFDKKDPAVAEKTKLNEQIKVLEQDKTATAQAKAVATLEKTPTNAPLAKKPIQEVSVPVTERHVEKKYGSYPGFRFGDIDFNNSMGPTALDNPDTLTMTSAELGLDYSVHVMANYAQSGIAPKINDKFENVWGQTNQDEAVVVAGLFDGQNVLLEHSFNNIATRKTFPADWARAKSKVELMGKVIAMQFISGEETVTEFGRITDTWEITYKQLHEAQIPSDSKDQPMRMNLPSTTSDSLTICVCTGQEIVVGQTPDGKDVHDFSKRRLVRIERVPFKAAGLDK